MHLRHAARDQTEDEEVERFEFEGLNRRRMWRMKKTKRY
jgi:hypothetical protein